MFASMSRFAERDLVRAVARSGSAIRYWLPANSAQNRCSISGRMSPSNGQELRFRGSSKVIKPQAEDLPVITFERWRKSLLRRILGNCVEGAQGGPSPSVIPQVLIE
jgi:hypothetical protein